MKLIWSKFVRSAQDLSGLRNLTGLIHKKLRLMSSINYIPWNLRMSCLLIVGILGIAPVSLPVQSIATGFGDVVYDGTYFYAVVKQQHQVAKLDKSGAVLSRYGRQGRGPGEFATHQLKLALG